MASLARFRSKKVNQEVEPQKGWQHVESELGERSAFAYGGHPC